MVLAGNLNRICQNILSTTSQKSERMSNEYEYRSGQACHNEAYLKPIVHAVIQRAVDSAASSGAAHLRAIDVGCGNGAFLHSLQQRFPNLELCGVEPSTSGVKMANLNYPDLNIRIGSGYDDLAATYGTFDLVVSLEVIEHVYAPRDFARTLHQLLKPDGTLILSTPFHGYAKNLMLAITGKMDSHFTALWDHGHIKFWSVKTLTELLKEVGYSDVQFKYAGRIPMFAKSMIAIVRK